MTTPTQVELAKRLGISRSTVAAALNPNSSTKLRESTRLRVQREAAKVQYRPDLQARLMRGVKSGMIGVLHFGGLNQVAAERAWHASRAIQSAEYQILSYDLSWTPGGARAACDAMLDARVEGVLVAGLNIPESIIELKAIQKRRIPMVTLSGNELPGVPHIRGDANSAMRLMTRHLLDLGKRKLLLLTHQASPEQPGSYLWASTQRVKGFKSAIKTAGGKFVNEFSRGREIQGCVIMSNTDPDVFDPYRTSNGIMQNLLQEASLLPEAVLCGNDEWAIGAMAAARAASLRIPQDIAFTGYDNIF
jgi:LacI family transcriptional regulator